jgi:hypothetical protein
MRDPELRARSSLARCTLRTLLCVLQFPTIYIIELATRYTAVRSFAGYLMAALLISIPLCFLGAAVMLAVRWYHAYSTAQQLRLRDLLPPVVVLIVHGVYIAGVLLSPWPFAFSGM